MKVKKGPATARELLAPGEYEALFEMQNGVCAICGHPPKMKRLNVDHDHRTGRIRGLLCHRCNRGLVWFSDNAWRLQDAAAYIERAEGKIK